MTFNLETTYNDPFLIVKQHPSMGVYYRKDTYCLSEDDKKYFEKAKKNAKNQNKFWSERVNLILPLNIPTLSENRLTEFSKCVSNLKDGFKAAIFQTPLVVAIPGHLVRAACDTNPSFIEYWDIREEGFWIDEKGFEWYLMVCDGRHRQVIKAAELQHPKFDNFADLKGTWNCEVVFANVQNISFIEKAFEEAHKLYLEINNKKIRKPSKKDNLGAEIKAKDPNVSKNVKRMENTGFQVEGGRGRYGDLNGILTNYSIFVRDALNDNNITDEHLKQTSAWLKLDPDWQNTVFSPFLCAALCLVQYAWPDSVNGNGAQELFEGWLKNMLTDHDSAVLASDWKSEKNEHNYESASIAYGMLEDFKASKLTKLKKRGKKYNTIYSKLTLVKVHTKLFPAKKEKKSENLYNDENS